MGALVLQRGHGHGGGSNGRAGPHPRGCCPASQAAPRVKHKDKAEHISDAQPRGTQFLSRMSSRPHPGK